MLRLCGLFLQRGETFRFLISCSGGFGSLAAGEQSNASDQSNELKLFHIYLIITRHSSLVTHHFREKHC